MATGCGPSSRRDLARSLSSGGAQGLRRFFCVERHRVDGTPTSKTPHSPIANDRSFGLARRHSGNGRPVGTVPTTRGGSMTVYRFCVVAFLCLVTISISPASATMKYGPLELSGNLQSQNLVRHPDCRRTSTSRTGTSPACGSTTPGSKPASSMSNTTSVHRELEALRAVPRRLRQRLRHDAGLRTATLRHPRPRVQRQAGCPSRTRPPTATARHHAPARRAHARASATRSSSTTSSARPTST